MSSGPWYREGSVEALLIDSRDRFGNPSNEIAYVATECATSCEIC
jgi:hypothetical protein